jgi:hypothetical protein
MSAADAGETDAAATAQHNSADWINGRNPDFMRLSPSLFYLSCKDAVKRFYVSFFAALP